MLFSSYIMNRDRQLKETYEKITQDGKIQQECQLGKLIKAFISTDQFLDSLGNSFPMARLYKGIAMTSLSAITAPVQTSYQSTLEKTLLTLMIAQLSLRSYFINGNVQKPLGIDYIRPDAMQSISNSICYPFVYQQKQKSLL